MAELYGRWQTAVDANLNAYPGALLYTFDSVATTTPKDTFVGPTLDPDAKHTNPVVANASGQFPQVFAEIGESYYLVLKTSAGVLIDDFENVDALGDTGAGRFERDFAAGGRWAVSGLAGEVSMEAGPPAGDDIGGDLRIGGWEGTQADAVEIDAAETTFTGNLTVTGNFAIDGDNPFEAGADGGTIAAAAGLLVVLPAGDGRYTLILDYLAPSTSAGIYARLGFAGAAVKSGADDYAWSQWERGPTSGTSSSADNSDDKIGLYAATVPTSALGTPTRLEINIISKAGRETGLVGFAHVTDDGTSYGQKWYEFSGQTRGKNYGLATSIYVYPSTGTISADWRLVKAASA